MSAATEPTLWQLLSKVSRSFDFAIRALPDPLREQACTAYLLCRIVDTVEDAVDQKNRPAYFDHFRELLRSPRPKSEINFSGLKCSNENETLLIQNCHAVFESYFSFDEKVRHHFIQHILEMTEGMAFFSARKDAKKKLIETDAELDRYCYFVAGTVGLLLTDLFAHHFSKNGRWTELQREPAIAFGLGLQKINILRDMNSDAENGVSYFHSGLSEKSAKELMNSALANLTKAKSYIVNIPSDETGVRLFCSWPYLSALLVLERLATTPTLVCPGQIISVKKEAMFAMMEEVEKEISDNHPIENIIDRYLKRCLTRA